MGTFVLAISYFVIARSVRKIFESKFNWRSNGLSCISVILIPLLPLAVVIPLEYYVISALKPDMLTPLHAGLLLSFIIIEGSMLWGLKKYGYMPEMHTKKNTVRDDLMIRPYYTYYCCWRELPWGIHSIPTRQQREALLWERRNDPKSGSQLAVMGICYTMIVGEIILALNVMLIIRFLLSGNTPELDFTFSDLISSIGAIGTLFLMYVLVGSLINPYISIIYNRFWPLSEDASTKRQWMHIFFECSLFIPIIAAIGFLMYVGARLLGLI